MTHRLLPVLAALSLAACGGGGTDSASAPAEPAQEVFDFQPEANRLDEVPPIDTVPDPATLGGGSMGSDVAVAMDGLVTIGVTGMIEETNPSNCLLMMSVDNGTDSTVTAGLFAFQVEGGGESVGANMFPQTAEPGERETAQIILSGQSCDVAQTITGGQPNCTVEGGGSCTDALEFGGGEVDFQLDD